MRRLTGCMVLVSTLVVCTSSGWGKGLSDADRAKVEALCREGTELLESENLAGAEVRFEGAIAIDRKSAPAHVGLGHVHLKRGDLESAEQCFKEARRRSRKHAPAYNGLGLVWRERPKGLRRAIGYFQEALRYDRKYLEARYHIAEARYAMQEAEVKREAEKLIDMDETFAPAYLLLGEWYETWKDDYEQAAKHYRHYLTLEPKDQKAVQRLGAVYQKSGAPAKVVELLREWVGVNPASIEMLPVLGVAHIALDSLDLAEGVFRRYLDRCEDQDRALYEDIKLLSSKEEYAAFQRATDRDAFLSRFWGDRDPDLTTPANERQLEHYRRVWYARQHFSGKKQPWDTRGEVYVRFGEPDHRSKSDSQDFQQSAAVQRVKEHLASQLYGGYGSGLILATFPIRSKADVGSVSRPVVSEFWDTSTVPWESWVYVNSGVGGGTDITFTDEMLNGTFDFAPVPADTIYDIRELAMLNRLSPRNVTMRTAARSPDYYQPPANQDPFGFYYDLADFRGASEATSVLEVYMGIPWEMAHYDEADDATILQVERTVGVRNEETGKAYRQRDDLVFRESGDVTEAAEGFWPDISRLAVPPGK